MFNFKVNKTMPADSPTLFYRRHSKTGQDVDDKFDVIVPKKNQFILVIVFLVLLAGQVFYIMFGGLEFQDPETWDFTQWWIIVLFLVLTIIPIMLWSFTGTKFGEKIIMMWLKKVTAKKTTTPAEYFVGFPFATKDPYYIEANPVDLDISNTGVFLSRVKEVIFLSIGISVVLSKVLMPFFFAALDAKWDYATMEEAIIDTIIYIGPLALLILFPIIPMMWMGEDMQIYRIDNLQDPHRLGFYLRTGLLSKVLGFFGIVLAFDIAKEYAKAYLTVTSAGINDPTYQLTLYAITFLAFFLILLAGSAAPFLVSLVYLIKYHQIAVTNLRIKASTQLELKCATFEVHRVEPKELEYLTHPEKVRAGPTFFNKTAGKIVLAILALAMTVTCFILGFIY